MNNRAFFVVFAAMIFASGFIAELAINVTGVVV
jgi:hypothetical protein